MNTVTQALNEVTSGSVRRDFGDKITSVKHLNSRTSCRATVFSDDCSGKVAVCCQADI